MSTPEKPDGILLSNMQRVSRRPPAVPHATSAHTAFEEQTALPREILVRRHNALQELAK